MSISTPVTDEAVQGSYDAVAAEYADRFAGELARQAAGSEAA